MASRLCAIEGAEVKIKVGSLNIQKAVNVRSRMSGTMIVEANRPSLGDSIGIIKDTVAPGARTFNGSTSVAYRAYSDTTVNNFTMGVWARAHASSASRRVVFGIGKATANGYALTQESDNKWAAIYPGVAVIGGGVSTVVNDEYVLLVVRRSSGTTQFYINGVAVGSTSASAPNTPNSDSFWSVGALWAGTGHGNWFDGDIAWPWWTNNVLTVTQLLQMATGGPGGMGISPDQYDPGNFFRTYRLGGDATENDTDGSNPLTLSSTTTTTDGPIVASAGAELLFAGEIEQAPESGFNGEPDPDVTEIRIAAQDYQGLPDRKILIEDRPSENLKTRLTQFVTYLSAFGVTLDASQDNGPTLEARPYDYVRMSEALDEISRETGRVFRINELKVASMYAPSAVAAPFDIDTADEPAMYLGDIEVEPTRQDYADKVYLRAGSDRVVEKTDTITGNGSTDTWDLVYPSVGTRGYVTANGVFETLSDIDNAAQWYWNRSANQLHRTGGNLTNGHVVTMVYDAQFPIVVSSGTGDWDILVEKTDLFDIDAAQALADAEVAIRSVEQRVAKYQTTEDGLIPGMSQDLTVTERGLSTTSFAITELVITDEANSPDLLRYSVKAVDGGNFTTWQRRYGGGSGGGGASQSIAASFVPSSLGGFGSTSFRDVAYNAGDYTGNGTITWTVDSGDVDVFQFAILGEVALIQIAISSSSISGTGDALFIAIPLTLAGVSQQFGRVINGAVYKDVVVSAFASTLSVLLTDGSNYATGDTHVFIDLTLRLSV